MPKRKKMNIKINCKSQTGFFINRDNIHDAYFNDVRRYPVLTEEQTKNLVHEYQCGETEQIREKAKAKLVEGNLRFVISIARKLGTQETFLDLVNEGNIGLIKAIEKFDPSIGCHLITYALSWIVAFMRNYLVTQTKIVVPPNALKLHNYVKTVTNEFFETNQRNPSSSEIAEMIREKFDFNIKNLEDVELGKIISIEEKYTAMGDNNTVQDSDIYIRRTSSNNIEDTINEEYKKSQLEFFLGKLDEREKYIVEKCYGIGCTKESFDTVGENLELGGERVRQICVNAVKKMRRYKNMVGK